MPVLNSSSKSLSRQPKVCKQRQMCCHKMPQELQVVSQNRPSWSHRWDWGLASAGLKAQTSTACAKGQKRPSEEPYVGDTPPQDPITGSNETEAVISPRRHFVTCYCNLWNPTLVGAEQSTWLSCQQQGLLVVLFCSYKNCIYLRLPQIGGNLWNHRF